MSVTLPRNLRDYRMRTQAIDTVPILLAITWLTLLMADITLTVMLHYSILFIDKSYSSYFLGGLLGLLPFSSCNVM